MQEVSDELHDEVSEEVRALRRADYPIDALFLNRWSPRAFSPEPIDDQVLMSVLEAARWAPSSFNEQPWRFLLARSPDDRKKFLDFLTPSNQVWAKNAPVLLLIISKKTFSHNGQPNATYHFDAGTCSAHLQLQARLNGLYMHGMAGFDRDMARATLGLPSDFEPLAVFALGRRGDAELLPPDVRAREAPNGRRPVQESIMEGRFVPAAEEQAEADTQNG